MQRSEPSCGSAPWGWLGPADRKPVWPSVMDLNVLILAGYSVLWVNLSAPAPTDPGMGWASPLIFFAIHTSRLLERLAEIPLFRL